MPDLDDLMAAVVSGNLPEVLSILDAPGAAPAIFDGQEDTVIWMACAHALNAGPHANLEREGIVNALLRAGAPPNPLSLMYSAGVGNVSITKLLLDAGADAQAVEELMYGASTALHRACECSAACVELLLAAGADSVVNIQCQSGANGPFFYPLDLAVKNIVDNPGTRARLERALPLLLRAGAICPTPYYTGLPSGDPYLDRVLAAGGFRRYEQRHINALAATFGPKLDLLPEIACGGSPPWSRLWSVSLCAELRRRKSDRLTTLSRLTYPVRAPPRPRIPQGTSNFQSQSGQVDRPALSGSR